MANEQRTVEVFDLSKDSRSSSDRAGLKAIPRTHRLSEPERSAFQKILGKKIGPEHSLQIFVVEDPKARSEKRINAMVKDLLKDEECADIDLEIERDNAELRATYLRTAELYTPEDIQGPSTKWKHEGRVFAIQDGGKDLFPAFQFADGKPLPVIKKILKALPEDMSPWETAFWFESSNGWLGGKTPQECLKNESKVIDAAEQFAQPMIG